jgi:protein-S-isoprenylcysteine O-methyltransferase Ste14
MIWLIAPQIFNNPYNLTALIIYYIISGIDIMIRPLPDKKTITPVEKASAAMGLLLPFIFILAYYENLVFVNNLIPFWNNIVISYIGYIFMVIGGFLMVLSRIQLGKYGTPIVHTGEGHELVDKGLYKYIRHPMYTGTTFVMFGPFLGFRSLLVTIGIFIFYFYMLNLRIKIEENVLLGRFGDEYRKYMKRTKRFIPFIF